MLKEFHINNANFRVAIERPASLPEASLFPCLHQLCAPRVYTLPGQYVFSQYFRRHGFNIGFIYSRMIRSHHALGDEQNKRFSQVLVSF